MRIKSVKCNPISAIGEGEVLLTLTDIEVGTVAKALEEYVKIRPEVTNFAHIKKAVERWQALSHLMNEGIFEKGE